MGLGGKRRRGLSSENLVGQAGPRRAQYSRCQMARTGFDGPVLTAAHDIWCRVASTLLLNNRSSSPMGRPTSFKRPGLRLMTSSVLLLLLRVSISGVSESLSAKNSFVFNICFWVIASLGCTIYFKFGSGYSLYFCHEQNSIFCEK